MVYADVVLADSPVGYWTLHEASGTTCADSSGNGHDLTYGGTPTYQQSGPLALETSYGVLLDGVVGEGAVSTYDGAWMLPAAFTLECWVKSTTTNGQVAIFGAFSSRPTGGPFGLFFDNSGRIKAVFVSTSGTFTTIQSGTGLNNNAWHHVAFTHINTGSSCNRLYIDGAEVAVSAFGTGTPQAVSAPIRIGGCGASNNFDWLDGTISQCAFYHTVLSASAIAAHYTAGIGVALSGQAGIVFSATGDLSASGGVIDLAATASTTATTSAAITLAQSLTAAALARASATGSMPTPGPGFDCWARELRPFVRYGRAVMFGYRLYYDDAGALAGSAQAAATASGDLSLTVIGLAGDAVVRVAVVGDLSTGAIVAEQMSGSAQVQVTATGDLQTNEIQGTAPVVSTATGQLRMTTPLSAEAVARAIAAGTPSVLVPLGGSAAVVEAATGAILARSGLAGSAADVASASAAIVTAMSASGSAASRAAAVASLMIGSSLAGQAAAIGTVTGALGVGIDLDADAQARASTTAATGVSTDLSGQVQAVAEATGTLRDIATVTGGITYAVNLTTGAVTNLLNFGFERLVTAHGGTLYGLKAGSLYAIGGDVDPGTADIAATLRFAPSTYGNIGQKRLETVYLYSRELDGLTVTPIYDEITGIAYPTIPLNRDGMRASRAYIGRGNAWHTLGLVVANRDGGKLDVGGIEPIVSNLSRKRR